MRLRLIGGTAAMLLALATAGAAQDRAEWASSETTRRVFTFVHPALTIDVLGEAPGMLRLIRGQLGQIEVTARALGGFAGSGLAGRAGDRLELTAIGAERVEYLVVVPAEVHVRVRLPDRRAAETFGTLERSATFSWKSSRAAADRTLPDLAGAEGL